MDSITRAGMNPAPTGDVVLFAKPYKMPKFPVGEGFMPSRKTGVYPLPEKSNDFYGN